MWHGQDGLRLRRLDTGLSALVDYGPEHYYATPRVVRVLDEIQIRRLLGDLMDAVDPDVVTQAPAEWFVEERRDDGDEPRTP